MEWNEEAIARLRALWAEGLSTAEIGRRLHVSKNAVVGKAHRLNLPPRPSPIRRPAVPAQAPQPKLVAVPGVVAPAHMPLPDLTPPPAAPVLVTPLAPMLAPRATDVPRPVLRSVPRPAASAASGRVTACCWPIGEPGTREFRFCDAASTPGKPYCSEHAAIAYVKVRDRREEAA